LSPCPEMTALHDHIQQAPVTGRPRAATAPGQSARDLGPGRACSYGRSDAGAGIDAALLSKAVGRPVRVQGMRYEGHG
jgi:hypothetical protein